MPTTKTRINITADKDIERSLVAAAKRDGVPTASKAAELLRLALELEEDLALSAIADERLTGKKIKWLSHKQVWK
ncbi:MAG: hypothetical protein UY36_C0012G0003 [Parcubacteria group bacterium GW2011_GWA1_49_11]|uniref:Uncharacterized protein n=1 Tax=Candidatus Yanofskybacteria bacterium RIFCSPHIGHO2_01_FULL_48_25b TaxID=1802672 RepID=A0A1F8F1N1_9BACT|nr:MAG: hypothetical protein UY36_C0012G0003 [Parcubacteria group bacterium GW2011_GWA1_49_11]OGN07025.1 MAG: hypothetical protein A2669_02475 [Candidatus Yanofskybacteria bacterium RIFCSPHIGHO2_01_FULL_48_25b]